MTTLVSDASHTIREEAEGRQAGRQANLNKIIFYSEKEAVHIQFKKTEGKEGSFLIFCF